MRWHSASASAASAAASSASTRAISTSARSSRRRFQALADPRTSTAPTSVATARVLVSGPPPGAPAAIPRKASAMHWTRDAHCCAKKEPSCPSLAPWWSGPPWLPAGAPERQAVVLQPDVPPPQEPKGIGSRSDSESSDSMSAQARLRDRSAAGAAECSAAPWVGSVPAAVSATALAGAACCGPKARAWQQCREGRSPAVLRSGASSTAAVSPRAAPRCPAEATGTQGMPMTSARGCQPLLTGCHPGG
mmetsp:Transcript_70511/g.200024  ORF Transcript_70511/g.200024 Transcript_70511/m.200024 type:complete len:248 (+) Transcript_70511:1604-2347(+)